MLVDKNNLNLIVYINNKYKKVKIDYGDILSNFFISDFLTLNQFMSLLIEYGFILKKTNDIIKNNAYLIVNRNNNDKLVFLDTKRKIRKYISCNNDANNIEIFILEVNNAKNEKDNCRSKTLESTNSKTHRRSKYLALSTSIFRSFLNVILFTAIINIDNSYVKMSLLFTQFIILEYFFYHFLYKFYSLDYKNTFIDISKFKSSYSFYSNDIGDDLANLLNYFVSSDMSMYYFLNTIFTLVWYITTCGFSGIIFSLSFLLVKYLMFISIKKSVEKDKYTIKLSQYLIDLFFLSILILKYQDANIIFLFVSLFIFSNLSLSFLKVTLNKKEKYRLDSIFFHKELEDGVSINILENIKFESVSLEGANDLQNITFEIAKSSILYFKEYTDIENLVYLLFKKREWYSGYIGLNNIDIKETKLSDNAIKVIQPDYILNNDVKKEVNKDTYFNHLKYMNRAHANLLDKLLSIEKDSGTFIVILPVEFNKYFKQTLDYYITKHYKIAMFILVTNNYDYYQKDWNFLD